MEQEQQAERAYRAVLGTWGDPKDEETWTEMMGDLRHLADQYGENLEAAVYIAISGGCVDTCETVGDVNVVIVDWDNYRYAGDYSVEDLRNKLDEVETLPQVGQVGEWRQNAIVSLLATIEELEEEERKEAEAQRFEKSYQGHVKYAAGEIISLQCHEERHRNCPEKLDGYDCECPCHSEEALVG